MSKSPSQKYERDVKSMFGPELPRMCKVVVEGRSWVRTKVPSKRAGRKGTRRLFKQKHPPGFVWFYREPSDVLVIEGKTIIATPQQADELRRHANSTGFQP